MEGAFPAMLVPIRTANVGLGSFPGGRVGWYSIGRSLRVIT